MDFSTFCPHCKTYQEYSLPSFSNRNCKKCERDLLPQASDEFKENFGFNQCPHCGAEHLYRQKDFNRKTGIALLAMGIVFSYWTYGLSLVAVTILDWCLYRKVGEVGCCYLCQSQFRNDSQVSLIPVFDLELHDYYQNLKK
ncbi:MAG: hypothetical protein FJ116_05735 [Deltaproteobacteria bacterium]|nr:hypothetical protein [Deltaproteobacteria bacterium]